MRVITLAEYQRSLKREAAVKVSPLLQGFRACNWGKSRLDCPYADGAAESKDWHEGFSRADDALAAKGL
jgi:ribosome modulation factor